MQSVLEYEYDTVDPKTGIVLHRRGDRIEESHLADLVSLGHDHISVSRTSSLSLSFGSFGLRMEVRA